MPVRSKTDEEPRPTPAVPCPSCGHKHPPVLDTLDRIEIRLNKIDRQQQQLSERQGAIEFVLRGGGLG